MFCEGTISIFQRGFNRGSQQAFSVCCQKQFYHHSLHQLYVLSSSDLLFSCDRAERSEMSLFPTGNEPYSVIQCRLNHYFFFLHMSSMWLQAEFELDRRFSDSLFDNRYMGSISRCTGSHKQQLSTSDFTASVNILLCQTQQEKQPEKASTVDPNNNKRHTKTDPNTRRISGFWLL